MYNTRNEVIKAFEDGVFLLKDGFQEKELDVLQLTDSVRVDKKTFKKIKDEVKRVKDKNIYVRSNQGSYIRVNNSYKLIWDIEYGRITHKEELERINKIHSDIKKIDNQEKVNENQLLILNPLLLVYSIFTVNLNQYEKVGNEYKLVESKINQEKSNEQPDTTDMPDLESK